MMKIIDWIRTQDDPLTLANLLVYRITLPKTLLDHDIDVWTFNHIDGGRDKCQETNRTEAWKQCIQYLKSELKINGRRPSPRLEVRCATCKSWVLNTFPQEPYCRKSGDRVGKDHRCDGWRASKDAVDTLFYNLSREETKEDE